MNVQNFASAAAESSVFDTIGALIADDQPDLAKQLLVAICQVAQGGGGSGSSTQPTGAANVATSQTAISTSATQVAAARATRTGLLIRNLDAAISIYIGPTSGVTSGNGMLLKAGESVPVTAVGTWYAIAASGTPTVAVLDEYA